MANVYLMGNDFGKHTCLPKGIGVLAEPQTAFHIYMGALPYLVKVGTDLTLKGRNTEPVAFHGLQAVAVFGAMFYH